MSLDNYLKFVAALGLVLVLILALAWAARRSGLGGVAAKPRSRSRRLGVVEVLTLDPKRRLVIVKRDGVEHLLLLGAASETVVERGFTAERFALPEMEGSGP